MSLSITLKPGELFVINGTLIRNGGKAAKLTIETQCRMLRETEIIREDEVDTPCKQVWMTLQLIHLSEPSAETQALLLSQIAEIAAMMPSAAPYVAAILAALDESHTHKALKEVKRLVQHERELAEQAPVQAGAA
ncbi:flagellar biosynthesis repressor FlbT [Methylobacterium aerolatum]|uniref:Flagellar protein FlbT n=1 Tax=Methylobacterium aerolatum TaxID=418708 RepID=A0ABU0HWC6_9HYPH|nr:flagellar biosynthesis repressor FlbT [Methylobacterium aerolatum]MDQ0446640.1 flagellar protein FlbT [Methylobacterium aerolatum]GJD33607.1 flagellum biosynthesis repressor protein FlbT [Methylobacterium aerolatum]